MPNQRSINHGAKVTSLIFDSKLGTTVNSKLGALIEVNNGRDDKLSEAIKSINKFNGRIVNMSGAAGSKNESLREWQKIASKGKLVVLASGNSYPMVENLSSNAEKFKNIGVGSIDPFGLVSPFSTQHSQVTVLAPCDFYSYSKGPHNVLASFDGTSCSAPLVSGVLANVLGILPDISIEDLKTLIKKTSIKTRIQFDGSDSLNGAGMLNAYKLILAAKKLKAKGYSVKKSDLVQAPDVYDFKAQSDSLLKDLNREHIGDKTCYGKFVKLNQARKAFFLNSENPQAIKKLSELYKEMNLPINASFFRSLLNEDDKGKNYLVELFNSTEKTKIDDSKEANNIVNERATIYASRINEKHPFVQHVVEQIDKLSSSSDQSARNKALNTAILLGPRGYRFVKKLSSDKASEIKDKATNQITLIENYPFDYNYPDSQKFWDN